MFVVQMRSRTVGDEELTSIGVSSSIGHGEYPWAVMLEVWMEFVIKAVAWRACPCSLRATSLNHEVCNHSVKF